MKPKSHQRLLQRNKKSHVIQVSVEPVESSSSSNEEFLYTLEEGLLENKMPDIFIKINDITGDMMVHSSASTDMLVC